MSQPQPPGPPGPPPNQPQYPYPQQGGPYGQPQYPAGNYPGAYPPNYRPVPAKQESYTWVIFVVLAVVLVPAIMAIVGAGFAFWAVRKSKTSLSNYDHTKIPQEIETKVPCKTSCKVTNVATYGSGFTVTVISNDNPNKTLTYRVESFSSTASLMYSTDELRTPVTFDVRADVDWTLLKTVQNDLNSHATKNHSADSLIVSPCIGTKGAVCIRGHVLTDNGDLDNVYDAKSGELRESH
ncbi:MAG: hypothetical protein U0271_17285 [Polyangiaceae bacterium]